jgi:hypothetical protein
MPRSSHKQAWADPPRFGGGPPRHGEGFPDVDAVLDWHPRFGDRGTVLAVTGRGDDVDAAGIRALLDGCALSEAEMRLDFAGIEDPFELESTL